MPGANTAGTPNTRDYMLGRGIIYASLLTAAGLPIAYRDLGNAPDFSISTEGEALDHEASRTGLKQVDKTVTLRQKIGVKFSLDEFNHENLADFFSGEKATHTNVAIAGFTVYVMVPDGSLQLGRWYDIKNAAGERAYDVQSGDLTVTTNEGTPVAMVLNTDYTLDSTMGRIFILSTSTVAATAIGLSKGLKVTLVANAAGNVVSEVRALTEPSIRVALKFISDNPADDGKRQEFQFHSCSLTASGELGMISDEWGKMEFSGVAERNTAADADSPTLTIRTVAD